MEQYRYLGSRMGSRHRVIEEVQADLQESPGEKGGAFFCSLAGFRDCYRLVYRMSELRGCELVYKRISERFSEEKKGWAKNLKYSALPAIQTEKELEFLEGDDVL